MQQLLGPRRTEEAPARAWAERTAEGNNEPDQRACACASFAEEPLHGLYCRRRWMRVTCRHDKGIRDDALWTALN